MIDLENAKKEFDKYANTFDFENKMVSQKHEHTYRVLNNSINIAKSMKLDEENINLAGLIGLLHDIARFYQATKYNTFNDNDSIDHGDYGCKILFEDGLIKNFTTDESLYDIIYKSVMYHNKYLIGNCNEKELLHSKIIRDADKLDILYNAANLGNISFSGDDSSISEEVEKYFFNEKLIKHEFRKTKNDSLMVMLAFIYDLNFDYSFMYIKENNILEKLYDKIENKEIFKKYFKILKEYVDRKCEECYKQNMITK